MAVMLTYIHSLLICMLIFRQVVASVDSRPLLQPPEDKVVNNLTEVNCTELEVSLKIHIEQQKLLLQKFDQWMKEHETNEYGEAEFEQIRYAEETISAIQEEFKHYQTIFESTIKTARISYELDKLENDSDTYISSIDRIQANFEEMVHEFRLISKTVDDFISLSNSYDQFLTLSVQQRVDEIAQLFDKHECATKIRQHQNIVLYENPLRMYKDQLHDFNDKYRQILAVLSTAKIVVEMLNSTDLALTNFRSRMHQFTAIKDMPEMDTYVAQLLMNITNSTRVSVNSSMEEVD